jgi:Ala-tRNA(Pro) deacylase
MAIDRETLFARLAVLGIPSITVEHAPMFTVEQSEALRETVPGAHTKNLFLDDKQGNLVLVVAKEDTKFRVTVVVDLALLHFAEVNCHPLENSATTRLLTSDLLRFIEACGHAPIIVPLD